MLDNILNSVRRGAERVQRRGEEVAQVTKLRVEIFQLTREQDGLYARLGRSFHAGADVAVLQGIREDIRRSEDEIQARERLIQELGSELEVPASEPAAGVRTAPVDAAALPAPSASASGHQEATVPDATPRPVASPVTSPSLPSQEAAMAPTDEKPTFTTADPTVQHSDEKLIPGDAAVGVGDEAGRDKMYRHPNTLKEGEQASRHPDPLDLPK